ncbi:hypothetical protein NKR19_g3993 [Coniochaeta hoffmannii]|uniref:Uncharacterized protein n=1 Tax=Coniochaeta hoffmannii TaxID=91930 RepID=A0AA38RUH8_9PEZI|nr:hypothetical protein NKR19_g3993 [Coniochaeta hoffmannii]
MVCAPIGRFQEAFATPAVGFRGFAPPHLTLPLGSSANNSSYGKCRRSFLHLRFQWPIKLVELHAEFSKGNTYHVKFSNTYKPSQGTLFRV